MIINTDVLIVGSGIAALQLATHLTKDKNVRILTKSTLRMTNSYLAQGGIAAALGDNDHPVKHIADTMEAGRSHNKKEIVEQILYEAPALIHEITQRHRVFDHDSNGNLLLGMEGAHSESRIVHSGGDSTGKHVSEYLIDSLPPTVTIDEDTFVYELLINPKTKRCIGVKAKRSHNQIVIYYAKHIILATGGCGQIYKYTSNAETVCGDGIALAYRAGADIVDMEFIQFHPTLLYLDGHTAGLISEAVRGDGAILITEDGYPIMEEVHPFKDLSPRHIVSQTIYSYLKRGTQVFLDITRIKDFSSRFPTISANCEAHGIDLSIGRIPVAPGCHFLMGGVKTDGIGRTSINGLYAIGETACTGLHGANRLASNSLLEGLYQGKKLAEWINNISLEPIIQEIYEITFSSNVSDVLLPEVEEIKDSMMDRVGIVRDRLSLETQLNWLAHFKIDHISDLDDLSIAEITKVFMLINAKLITEAAILRTESRGGHYRNDYPFEDKETWLGKSITHIKNKETGINHEQTKVAITT